MATLEELLTASARLHNGRLCPRQVLGVRMSQLAGRLLDLDLPQRDKRLLVIVETYGCAADGVAVGAGCWVGRRTLRVVDYGKVAATYVDTATERAVRIAPRPEARKVACEYAPEAPDRWHAQLIGYQRIPDDELLTWRPVALQEPLAWWLGEAGRRVQCERCGEEVLNQRELIVHGATLCRACAGQMYYRLIP